MDNQDRHKKDFSHAGQESLAASYEDLSRRLQSADEAVEPSGGWQAAQARLWRWVAENAVARRRVAVRWLGAGLAVAATIVIGALGLWVHALTVENTSLKLASASNERTYRADSVAMLPMEEARQFLSVWNEIYRFFEDAPAWVARTNGRVRMGISEPPDELPGAAHTPVMVRVALCAVESDRRIVSDMAMLSGYGCTIRLTTPSSGLLEVDVSDVRVNHQAALRVQLQAYGASTDAAEVTAELTGHVRTPPGVAAVVGAIQLADGLYRVEVSAHWRLTGSNLSNDASS